ncbi:hypothetical protein HMPREF3033_01764 [Veillonellaceae bacterium DNF00751]|nr:hypothetical protein HMPREF3033_01764 [Veillonellaceae bacterium DNF00751]
MIKAIKFVRLRPIKAVAQNRFRRVLIGLIIQAVGTAKIGNAAFRRNPGTAEKYNIL